MRLYTGVPLAIVSYRRLAAAYPVNLHLITTCGETTASLPAHKSQ
jgi:hypothetical protein